MTGAMHSSAAARWKGESGYAAADGQMGQIIQPYMDWRLSGDNHGCERCGRQKNGLSFAWVPGGWDSHRGGVLDGVQHNTYDVEFYGPNPICGIYYLGALRAGEEMARAPGECIRRRISQALRQGAVDRSQSLQRNTIFRKFGAFELTRLLLICVAIWVPEIPRAPNTR